MLTGLSGFSQNIACSSSHILRADFSTLAMVSLRSLLRRNIESRMRVSPDVDSPARLARRCRWPRGRKKGQVIGARTIGYIFEDREDSPSPSVDLVEAIATALGVKPWELMIDIQMERDDMLGKIFASTAPKTAAPPVRVDDRRMRTQDLSAYKATRRKL